MRGFFEIGIYHPKTETNVGTLWRSAMQLVAAGIFTVGRRYKKQSSDTLNSYLHVPCRHYDSFESFLEARPLNALLVGIEMGGLPLKGYCHPPQAIYLLGAEDNGLPSEVTTKCNSVISLEAVSYNVAVAGSIVMYHRQFLSK